MTEGVRITEDALYWVLQVKHKETSHVVWTTSVTEEGQALWEFNEQ